LVPPGAPAGLRILRRGRGVLRNDLGGDPGIVLVIPLAVAVEAVAEALHELVVLLVLGRELISGQHAAVLKALASRAGADLPGLLPEALALSVPLHGPLAGHLGVGLEALARPEARSLPRREALTLTSALAEALPGTLPGREALTLASALAEALPGTLPGCKALTLASALAEALRVHVLPEAGLAAPGALGPVAPLPLELLTALTLELPALRPLELLAALALRRGEGLGPRPGLFEALAEVFEGLLALLGTEVGHPLPDSLHHLAALFGRHRGQVLAEHLAEFGLRALRLALAGALAGALALSLAPVALGAVAAHGRGGVGLPIGLGRAVGLAEPLGLGVGRRGQAGNGEYEEECGCVSHGGAPSFGCRCPTHSQHNDRCGRGLRIEIGGTAPTAGNREGDGPRGLTHRFELLV
jgi:hypothetical protein